METTILIFCKVIFTVLTLLSMVCIWTIIESIETPSSIRYKYIGSEGTIINAVMCKLYDGRTVRYSIFKKEIKKSLKEALSYKKFVRELFFEVTKAGRIINFLSLAWIWGYLVYIIAILIIYGWKLLV